MLKDVLLTHKPTIILNGTDITDLVTTLSITESLFDPVIRGYAQILNTAPANVYQTVNTLGELPKIEFSFHSLTKGKQEAEITPKDLHVYDINVSPTDAGGNVTTITLNFMSKEYFTNQSRLVSKYFHDKISSIVKDLCKEIDIKCETEETDEKLKRVLPYDSVFSHVIRLSKSARTNENPKDVDYIFYQDLKGKHYFKRISSFKNKGVKWEYSVRLPKKDISITDAKYSVIKYDVESVSPMRNALEGMYSSEIITFDTTFGLYYSKTHVYDIGKYTTLWKNPLVEVKDSFKQVANSGVAVRRFNKQRFLFDSSEEESGQDKVGYEDDWVGDRLATMQHIDQNILYLNVPGNSDVKAGDIIEVRNLIDEGAIKESKVNLKMKDVIKTGRFLITTVSHDLLIRGGPKGGVNTEYIMRIRAIKDSRGGEYA